MSKYRICLTTDLPRVTHTFTASNALERAIANSVRSETSNRGESFFHDLAQGGCQSGTVGSMIYYTRTLAFYAKHRDEICALLYDAMHNYGTRAPGELLSGWDDKDPLALEETNQNLLAWFAYETIARQIAVECGVEV